MMERYTEAAQEALQRARGIMLEHGHTQLDVEHIFLALLSGPNSVPAKILAELGVGVPATIDELETALRSERGPGLGRGPATSYATLRANRVLHAAAEEAQLLNEEFISTTHLLMGVTTQTTGESARIMRAASIDHDKVLAFDIEHRRSDLLTSETTRQAQVHLVPKQIVTPDTLPKPVGFSHGIVATGGRLLFLAGQTALDTEGRIVAPGDVVVQYRRVLGNLKAVVEKAGGMMTDIVKITIFVRDRDDYKARLKELGQVHKEFFGAYYPATALLEISRFYDDEALIEIEGIAVLTGNV